MGRDCIDALVQVLDGWEHRHVAVRVVASPDDLIVVFSGRLAARLATKGASLFWPVKLDGAGSPRLEQPGIYAHPELVSRVHLHVGGFVVDFVQAGVTVNVRRLDRP
jgi:hypothetical protein